MMKKFFKKKTTVEARQAQNPYTKEMAGRKEWDDRYFNMKEQIKKWQLACGVSLIASVALIIVVGKLATQSAIQPFVVEVCNNSPQAILPVTTHLPNEEKLIEYALKQFVLNSRTVIADTEAEKALLNKVYAYSADNTITFLHDFYAKQNPFDMAAHTIVQPNIIHTSRISAQTWQLYWEENKRSLAGNEIIEKTKWVATITYKKGAVNPRFINENPFGIYVSQLAWSQINN